MEEELEKSKPENHIGTAERRGELSQQIIVGEEVSLDDSDPYGGKLKKTNIFLLALIILSSITLAAGLGILIYKLAIGAEMNFANLKLGIIISAAGFVAVVVFGILKTIVENKRRASYTSTHTTKINEKFEPKKVETESAKRGLSTSETTLNVSDSKEDYKYCPHCHARIPKSSGMFCPKCGKRLDSAPIND